MRAGGLFTRIPAAPRQLLSLMARGGCSICRTIGASKGSMNGTPVLRMEETFAKDVGLTWEGGGVDVDFGGEQAEDAEVVGGRCSRNGRNYNGSGFVDMGKMKGAYVEWYRENDGDAAKATLSIRYSGRPADKEAMRVHVSVNGTSEELALQPAANWGKQWRNAAVPITLDRGANTIRLTAVDDRGLLIDEIAIK